MNFSGNINNIIIGSVILLISVFFGYRFLSNPQQIEDNDNSKPKIIIKEDNIINEYLEKNFQKF